MMPHLDGPDAAQVDASRADRLPRVGDVWVASWDGVDLGIVLLAAVRNGYSLVWPVTDDGIAASFPCFYLPTTGWLSSLIVWPEAEAGISHSALSRRLDLTLSDRQTRAVHVGVVDQDDGLLPGDIQYAEVRDEDPEGADALADVCTFAGQLCDLDWTEVGLGAMPFS